MQVVFVYLEWFRCNSRLKCVSRPEIVKYSLKPLFLKFKVVQGHRCWYHRKARQQCLCQQQVCVYLQPFSRYRRANGGKITISQGGTPL